MRTDFRDAMHRLHTGVGVTLGGLLLVIFWMGTLSVFDREIDRWMMPETRLSAPHATLSSFDDTVLPHVQHLAAPGTSWRVSLASARTPFHTLRYTDADGASVRRHIDPLRGELLDGPHTAGASGFFFPFHFSLHLGTAGYWIAGLAGMAMLVLIVSGVLIHRRLLADFFTFRPSRALPRASLDAHNLTGVIALPFHFMITLSGLVIFFAIYFPATWHGAYAETAAHPQQTFNLEAFGSWSRPAAHESAGNVASVDAMIAEARRLWGGPPADQVRGWHAGDAAGYIAVRRSFANEVRRNVDVVFFDAANGERLYRHTASTVVKVQRFLAGLHFLQFDHWPLRWLYFAAGLAGCVMIGSGLLFWLAARRRQSRANRAGLHVVTAIAVTTTSGLMNATLAFLVANKVLPVTLDGRAGTEMQVFFIAWAVMFAHALWRGARAWREQCALVAGLAIGAATLNWGMTGQHPIAALQSDMPAIAGVDLMLLALGFSAAAVTRRLSRNGAADG